MATSKTPQHAKPARKAAATAARTAKPAARVSATTVGKPASKASPVRPPSGSSTALKKGETVKAQSAPKTARFNDKDLAVFQKELLALRDRLTGQVARMRQDSLKRDDEVNPEEDGTDAFDRLFALERAGSDQDIIFTIDESIRAIGEGKYGVCDACGKLIEKPRLHALPFAKNCIQCQSEMERGRRNGGPRRLVP
jgi:RNA polymerase-binding transcription factor DksA